MMMVSRSSRPIWERSYIVILGQAGANMNIFTTDLDVVSLMVVAALSKQSMVDDVVNVELVQQGVAILISKLGW